MLARELIFKCVGFFFVCLSLKIKNKTDKKKHARSRSYMVISFQRPRPRREGVIILRIILAAGYFISTLRFSFPSLGSECSSTWSGKSTASRWKEQHRRNTWNIQSVRFHKDHKDPGREDPDREEPDHEEPDHEESQAGGFIFLKKIVSHFNELWLLSYTVFALCICKKVAK